VSRFARAATIGLQGEDPAAELSRPDRIAAVLKDLAAQGAAAGGHNAGAAAIGPRECREIHLPPARAGALAGARSFMVAYNEIDGIPCCTNPELLNGLMRDTYGFKGIMMADGTALDILRNQAGTYEEAGIRAVRAGVDLSLWDTAFRTLADSVRAGKLEESVIDTAVARVLRLKFELGLFEHPFVDEDFAPLQAALEHTRRLNLRLTRETLVLLKNDGGVLPFRRDVKRVAVIGPAADSVYAQLGDYTPPQRDGETTTLLAGIRELLGPGIEVVYAQGCPHRGGDASGIPAAVALAKSADVVVVAVGGSSNRFAGTKYNSTGAAAVSGDREKEMDTGEGVDLADLNLGGVQLALVQALQAAGKPLAVVLVQGRPFTIPWIAGHCPAILNAWYPGQEGGRAMAEALFGVVNPSGRLSISMPRSAGQLPDYYDYKFRGDDDYYGLSGRSLFPFGFGLSYTTFTFSNLKLSTNETTAAALNRGEALTCSIDVANTGDRPGKETVQVYLHGVTSEITRRVRELKAFKKIELQPGEKRTVSFPIGRDELAIWGRDMKFAVRPGRNEIMVQGGATKPIVTELLVK
jgi:beta-glucosidase